MTELEMQSRLLRLVLVFLACTWLLAGRLHAGMPIIPFSITLAKAQAITYEGDPINFNVTVQNTHPTRRLPLLIPTGQAGYNKIFYFKIYDAASNLWQARWVESREVTLSQKTLSLPTLRYLNPGEKVIFSANLLDFPRSFTHIESNHMLTSPMFAGRYKVYLIYDPTGNPIGDTLYKYYEAPILGLGEETSDKLLFPIYGKESEPYMLDIRKSDKSMIVCQNWTYTCNRRPRTDIWEYARDNQVMRLIEVKMDSSNSRYEAEIDPETKKTLRAFTWFPDHNIKEFRDYGLPPCNAPRQELRMEDANRARYNFSYREDGTYLFEHFNEAGVLEYIYRYTVGSDEVLYRTYKVKQGRPKAAQSETWKLARPFDPCSFTAHP